MAEDDHRFGGGDYVAGLYRHSETHRGARAPGCERAHPASPTQVKVTLWVGLGCSQHDEREKHAETPRSLFCVNVWLCSRQ